MVKFEDYKYEELNFEEVGKEMQKLVENFANSKTAKKAIEALYTINDFMVNFTSNVQLCSIRFSQNVNDKYYSEQQDILDAQVPNLAVHQDALNKAILASPFQKQITKEFGPRLVLNAEVASKTFKPEIIEDLVEENKLSSQYSKLKASAKIKFLGKTYNLSNMGPLLTSQDRDTRKAASKAYWGWFAKHQDEIDEIYDKMVHCRDNMAKKLGFKSYVDLQYLNLGRTDYNRDDVKLYRDEIYKSVVPVTKKLFKRQAERLNIKGIKYYDYNLQFTTGNAKPHGSNEELVEFASKMYKEMSPETDEFFTFMRECNLLDLVARDGKEGGGYTTSIPSYKAPFIFSNFNGTSGDVDVLTHEAGHAFMGFRCRDAKWVDNIWPTLEACEIHSMSMEFFAYPWMEMFFQEETEKYKFSHLSGTVTFLPYGVAVDEFQTWVYDNPDCAPADRRAKWREIEKKYLPHLKYTGNKFLENGGYFFKQSHIFNSPLYYIDYTIAQVCAFQFFNAMNIDYKEAWNRYVNLCNLGGSTTFLNLLKDKGVKLESPFKKGVVKKTIKPIKAYLDKFDDKNM